MKELQKKFNVILKKDDNSKGNGYIVRSLYFDSMNNYDFNTKLAGTKVRKKIRIRVYDPDDTRCKLEMKKKDGDYSHKISVWITRDDAIELTKGKYHVLQKYFDKSKEAVEIFTVMSLGCYRPVVMIEYQRIAYTYPMYDTRLTFDFNIRSSEANFNLFDKEIMYNTIINNETILEVKYNEKLMGFINETLKPFHLNRISISKYCMGRKIFYDFNY
jgi:hypothetical protein